MRGAKYVGPRSRCVRAVLIYNYTFVSVIATSLECAGIVDSSGLRFFYTTEEPEQRAGIIMMGHDVTRHMLIPPRTQNFTITGICSIDCTNTVRHVPTT